ncbi:MAG TPA: hypothetical protein VFT27_10380 [Actinomycetota bacterium]|nr:hypothetical protein [Actinomycetota bacterium]
MDATARIWAPTGLGRRKDVASLAYVVIDELESGFVGLTINAWPAIDELGRLRFDLAHSLSVGATERELHAYLTKHRTPRKIADRPLRIGDAFACRIRPPILDGELADPSRWMVPPITDVSAEARNAAKLAYFSAAAPVVDRRTHREVVELAPESTPQRSMRSPAVPDPFAGPEG